MSAQDFTEDQRRYLEGFVSGVQARRASQGLKPLGTEGGGTAQPAGPDKEHLAAMARFDAAGKIRNVTGSPTAGIDRQELLDTRPYANAWHYHILNDRSLYGLPRKFNVGFDGGGVIPVLEDTNDIAFTAVRVGEGAGVDAGIWFRLGVGGITGHQDFAKLGGVYVKPEEAVAVADAIVRVFIANGDRTDRKKARLKYVLDAWGLDKFLAGVEAKLGAKLVRLREDKVSAPNRQDRSAH